MNDMVWSVTDFVASLNQTLEFAYPTVAISGELANFRVSKNKWIYFDLKDDTASVRFFGTIYALPGPLEDGMMLEVRGLPRLHPLYGFSVTAQTIRPVGEGSIKQAAALLEAKLQKEGLFDDSRKRSLPYPPQHIGLITSSESAAHADFIKVLGQRWSGLEVSLIDVQVQGELAVPQLVAAIEQFNTHAKPPEVLVLTRGGGSADDLAAFSSEQVTRAVAASRIPTLVAIGHEIDWSLAERAADQRASTPSNAAELLVPHRKDEKARLITYGNQLSTAVQTLYAQQRADLANWQDIAAQALHYRLAVSRNDLRAQTGLLEALSPQAVLKRGYAILRAEGKVLRTAKAVLPGKLIEAQLQDGTVTLRSDKGVH